MKTKVIYCLFACYITTAFCMELEERKQSSSNLLDFILMPTSYVAANAIRTLGHEFGHALTARAFGNTVKGITLHYEGLGEFNGGTNMIMSELAAQSPIKKIIIWAAGPIAGIITATGLGLLAWKLFKKPEHKKYRRAIATWYGMAVSQDLTALLALEARKDGGRIFETLDAAYGIKRPNILNFAEDTAYFCKTACAASFLGNMLFT